MIMRQTSSMNTLKKGKWHDKNKMDIKSLYFLLENYLNLMFKFICLGSQVPGSPTVWICLGSLVPGSPTVWICLGSLVPGSPTVWICLGSLVPRSPTVWICLGSQVPGSPTVWMKTRQWTQIHSLHSLR